MRAGAVNDDGRNVEKKSGRPWMRFLRRVLESLADEQDEPASSDDDWADRRVYVRFAFDGAEFPLLIDKLRTTLRLRDLSCGGASAFCETPVNKGDIVHLELEKNQCAAAEILWVRQMKIGLKFVNALDPMLVRKVHEKRRNSL